MANANLHPATARQAGYAAWTADPAVTALFAALRDLDRIGRQLARLHRDRPELGADAALGEVGEVATLIERCPALGYDHGWRVRANGGACAGLWALLGQRRAAWIAARLEVVGLEGEADSVEEAWAEFSA